MSGKRGFPMGHRHLKQTKEWYDTHFGTSKSALKPWNEQPHRTVAWYPALLLCRGRIFEVGCGAGHFAAMCADFGLDYEVGTDYSAQAIEKAKQNADSAEFREIDVDKIEYTDALLEFLPDTVVALEVLEHVWDDLAVIRPLSPGTRFVASVPDFFTEGHVRWFASEEQVVSRYSPLVEIDRIITEAGVNSNNRWFVFSGIRR